MGRHEDAMRALMLALGCVCIASAALASAAPGCAVPLDHWGHGWTTAVAAAGKTVVAGAGEHLLVVAMRQDGGLEVAGEVRIGAEVVAVAVAGERAVAALGSGGLAVVDLARPGAPAVIGRAALDGVLDRVVLAGGVAYLADSSRGAVRIVDLADPAAPVEVAWLELDSEVQGLALAGNRLYVVLGHYQPFGQYNVYRGVRVLDVIVPSAPVELGRSGEEERGRVRGAALVGDLLLVAGERLRAVSVADPTAPLEVASLDSASGEYLAVAGTTALLATPLWSTRSSHLVTVGVADPVRPAELGALATGWLGVDAAAVGERVVMAARRDGLRMLDLADPAAPLELAPLVPAGRDVTDVALVGGVALVADGGPELALFAITNEKLVGSLPGWRSGDPVETVEIAGDLALVGPRPLRLLDVSDPLTPRLVGSLDVAADCIATADGVAVTVAGDWGDNALTTVDIRAPSAPAVVGVLPFYGPGYDLAVGGGLAAVASWSLGVLLVDVSAPSAPRQVGNLEDRRGAYTVAFAGDLLLEGGWLGLGQSGAASALRVVGVADPSRPELLAERVLGGVFDLAPASGLVYVAGHRDGVVAFDLARPRDPREVGAWAGGYPVDRVAVGDGLALAGLAAGGLELVRVVGCPVSPVRRPSGRSGGLDIPMGDPQWPR